MFGRHLTEKKDSVKYSSTATRLCLTAALGGIRDKKLTAGSQNK